MINDYFCNVAGPNVKYNNSVCFPVTLITILIELRLEKLRQNNASKSLYYNGENFRKERSLKRKRFHIRSDKKLKFFFYNKNLLEIVFNITVNKILP